MNNALLSGLSGLRSNQRFLDVIGNNLANSGVTGFKSRRVNFRDVLGQTFSPGSGPTESLGGLNPVQMGRGAAVGSIDVNMVQGSLLRTGRTLDLGIEGHGFFVLNNGNMNHYSRVGTFDIDSDDFMVDLVTGFRVQSVDGSDIQIPSDQVQAPQASGEIEFTGNLTADVTGPLPEILQTVSPFEAHFAAQVTSSGTSFTFSDIAPGVPDRIELRIDGGPVQTINVPAGTYNAAQLATILNDPNNGMNGATAADVGGQLVISSDTVGSQSEIFLLPPSPPGGPTTGNNVVFQSSVIGVAQRGTEQPATATTDINDLSINTTDYVTNDTIDISGTRPDGTPVNVSFVYGVDGTTLGDLLNRADGLFNVMPGGATYQLDANGNVTWTAHDTGEASFTLTFRDGNSATGISNWSSSAFSPTQQGTDPDEEEVVATVYDGTGTAHAITLTFQRQDDGSWSLIPSVDAAEGTVVSPTVTGITFGPDGTLLQAPSSQLQVQWAGVAGSQTIDLALGTAGEADGLTQFGTDSSVSGIADGFPAGNLASISVRSDGTIEGFFTNGRIMELERIALATFRNPEGLSFVGNGMYLESPNSGLAQIVGPQEGAAGSILGGSLEASNVDIAEEFVRLIEAQRAFQANARMISTTDEVLAELVNIV